jgi:hypothetical protein
MCQKAGIDKCLKSVEHRAGENREHLQKILIKAVVLE